MKIIVILVSLSSLFAFFYIGVTSAMYLFELETYTAADYLLSLFLTLIIANVATKLF